MRKRIVNISRSFDFFPVDVGYDIARAQTAAEKYSKVIYRETANMQVPTYA